MSDLKICEWDYDGMRGGDGGGYSDADEFVELEDYRKLEAKLNASEKKVEGLRKEVQHYESICLPELQRASEILKENAELKKHTLERLAEMCNYQYDFRIDFESREGEFQFRLFDKCDDYLEVLELFCSTIKECAKGGIDYLKEESK